MNDVSNPCRLPNRPRPVLTTAVSPAVSKRARIRSGSGWFARLTATTGACLLLAAPIVATASAGRVAATAATVTVTHADGKTAPLKRGEGVEKGDTISTDSTGWAVLMMEDGGSITLRSGGKLRIDDYLYDPEQPKNGRSWLSLLQGSLRSITGAIGKLNPGSYQLTAGQATIGIRGTDFDVVVVNDASDPTLPPGVYHTVNAGGTTLKGADGSVDVAPGRRAWLANQATAGNRRPQWMTERQRPLWDRLQQFDRNARIGNLLAGLHKRSGAGFTLDTRQLQRGRNLVERALRRAEKRQERRDVEHGHRGHSRGAERGAARGAEMGRLHDHGRHKGHGMQDQDASTQPGQGNQRAASNGPDGDNHDGPHDNGNHRNS